MALDVDKASYVRDGFPGKSGPPPVGRMSSLLLRIDSMTDRANNITAELRSTADAIFGAVPELGEAADKAYGASNAYMDKIYSALEALDTRLSEIQRQANRLGDL